MKSEEDNSLLQKVCDAISVYTVQSAFKGRVDQYSVKGEVFHKKGDSFLSMSSIAFYARMKEEKVSSIIKGYLEPAKFGGGIALYNSVKPRGRGRVFNLYDWASKPEMTYCDRNTKEVVKICKHPTMGVDVVQKGLWGALTPYERYIYYLIRERAQSIVYGLYYAGEGPNIEGGIMKHCLSCDWISSDKMEAIKKEVQETALISMATKTVQRAFSKFQTLHLIEYKEEDDPFFFSDYGIELPEEFDYLLEEESIADNGYILRRGFPMFDDQIPEKKIEKSTPNNRAKKKQEQVDSLTPEQRKKNAERLGLRLKEEKTEEERKDSEGGVEGTIAVPGAKVGERASKTKVQDRSLLNLLEKETKESECDTTK